MAVSRRSVIFIKALVVVWVIAVSLLFIKPVFEGYGKALPQKERVEALTEHISTLEDEVDKQTQFYKTVLQRLSLIAQMQKTVFTEVEAAPATITVLLIACNREDAVRRSLDLLLKHRPDPATFPIIVSQDCGHQPTRDAILSYGDQVSLIEQPDLSVIEVPPKERKFKGYFYIARHYKWALDQVFADQDRETVIIVEDDLDISPDFYSYFLATEPILRQDPTLWCVSAWNDNGKAGLVDTTQEGAETLYRSDFFPGLGWMLPRRVWAQLSPKWPSSYWDDWMRAPLQRNGRTCLRPEVSRTRTFGKKGVSNGLFYDKHLKYIHLNDKSVDFSKLDLSYLKKDAYDEAFKRRIQAARVVSLQEVTARNLPVTEEYRIIYRTKEEFKKATKSVGLMDDFKAGVPRTGYLGVVTFLHHGRRVFLAPGNSWRGYDPSWS